MALNSNRASFATTKQLRKVISVKARCISPQTPKMTIPFDLLGACSLTMEVAVSAAASFQPKAAQSMLLGVKRMSLSAIWAVTVDMRAEVSTDSSMSQTVISPDLRR